METREYCDMCGDVLYPGNEYYLLEEGCFCPDCFDAKARKEWLRYVGDTVERI